MKDIIVIGLGMVGFKFCQKFVNADPNRDFQITVFGDEPRFAYDRVHLSELFDHRDNDRLSMTEDNWYKANAIEIHTGTLVTEIDRVQNRIRTHHGTWFHYDILVIASGSKPFIPAMKGTDLLGVFVYRTIEDVEGIIQYSQTIPDKSEHNTIVIGGGLLGLEAAKSALDLQLKPMVVEFAKSLMNRQLDEDGASILKEKIEDLGVKVCTASQVVEVCGKEGKVDEVVFSDGSTIKANMVIVSAGIRPRDELATGAGLQRGSRGGIAVDNFMQTNVSGIYAIGEVASYLGQNYGLVAPGYEMAEVAVSHILGSFTEQMPTEVDMSTKLKLIGVDVASFGDPFCVDIRHRKMILHDEINKVYKRLNLTPDKKNLLGGILVGDAKDYNTLLQLYKNRMVLKEGTLDRFLAKENENPSSGSALPDLPDDALICSCEKVTKGEITNAVKGEEACSDVLQIMQCTKAATGCGGCKPMVSDLANLALKSLGKEAKRTICAHFQYSRQEIFDLIRVKQIMTYDEALDKIGQGDGCEICKPALASVFASIYNETANRQTAIQDTNDRFLANIQRNGTYSVVPRVPGGEITADKLIAIGQVARKYNLYTKITGGQRIDLFGATLNQLPFIWEELISAGFESGHAYGKALRTVKSCVGSTWCRFGMDESISFAIEVENRYKGLRSPHKIKGGVSGCIRECAEARSKDFGLIATEKGYNLYVCGNGGANPKHAQLLAEDLDRPLAIKYLDRFLMYYLRTADPLTRTAPWLEKMDGGIDHLRDVIIHDTLSLGQELEAQMEDLIQAYQCEWKEAIGNPTIRKRFSHFFNSKEADTNLKFVPLREQYMPAPWE